MVLESARCARIEISFILDDNARSESVHGIPLRDAKTFELQGLENVQFIVSIGNNHSRASIFRRLSLHSEPFNVLHPFSYISENSVVGKGVAIMAGVIVNAGASVSDNVILNTGCSVDHDCIVEPHVHIGPGVHLAGDVTVGAYSLLGVGVSVTPGISIGKNCIIGAGSTVVSDIPDNSVAFGVPARVVRKNEVPFPG